MPFDNSDSIGHNEEQVNDENAIIVRMSEKAALNDPACEHNFQPDPSDIMGDYIAHVCHKCGIGHFLPR